MYDGTDGIEIRRNGRLAGAVALTASVPAVAYLVRAAEGGTWVDWVLCAALLAMVAGYARAAYDARTPLLVADVHGVRMRLGRSWQGLTWEDLDAVEHLPRRGWWRDGRLVLHVKEGHEPQLDSRGTRHARLAERWYGAPFAVPLALTTRATVDPELGETLLDGLATLSGGRTAVVEAVPAGAEDQAASDEAEAAETPRKPDESTITPEPVVATATPVAAREVKPAVRVEAELAPVTVARTEETTVRDAGAPAWSSATVVLGDFADRPTVDPVLGPKLFEARDRLGLTIDQLAERTRIRPHVIEAMEVDDFTPCGGDFYARGHLRTLARILGLDAAPLLATYDEKYADSPVDPRKVFEAELAHGHRAALRGASSGGPRWSVLVAAVMTLVLAWSVARLVLDNSTPVATPVPGFANSSGSWQADQKLAPPVPVAVTAEGGGAHVVIRDAGNRVVFKGALAFGATQQFKVSPPVRVQSSDGSLRVEVDGRDCGPLGQTGRSAQDALTTEC